MKDAAAFGAELHRDVHEVVSSSGSTFTNGMRILAAPRRKAIFAVYAFCRIVDDIVDGDGSSEGKLARISLWEREIDGVFSNRPETAIGRELRQAAVTYELPQEEFHLILDGMRMDVAPMLGPDRARLDAYIRRVAGAVGLLSMRVFGAWRGEPSRRFALALAEAMQLTNILRDVEEDARIGRVYLPREVLDAVGVPADPVRLLAAPNLPEACRALGLRARQAFRIASREVPAHGRVQIAPALLMMGPYERLLARMEADWSRPPPRRASWRKALDGARCLALGGAGR
jgi:presqualene diphosphate synthase